MITSENAIFIFFLIGAFLTFLPLLMGHKLVTEKEKDPPYLEALSFKQYTSSLVASIAATAPIVGEAFLDLLLWTLDWLRNKKTTKRIAIYDNTPLRAVIFLVILPDALFLFYILPQNQYNYIPGLVGARDTMFIYTFLAYMVNLQTPVWTWPRTIIIGISFMCANILAYPSFPGISPTVTMCFVSIGLSTLALTILNWINYISHMDFDSLPANVRLCNVHVIFYTIFMLADWIPFYFPNAPISWTTVGTNYLTMYTYLMASCILAVTVISTRMAKSELANFQVSYRIVECDA